MINEQMSHRLATAATKGINVTGRNWPFSQHHRLYNEERPRRKREKKDKVDTAKDREMCERAEEIYI